MLNGFYNIIKPAGMTSSDVVVVVRGILRRHYGQKIKVGHFGTLDPYGVGVLPVSVGRATRLFNYNNGVKVYRAGFRFGTETDTLDSYGNITKTCDNLPNINEINAILPKFIGKFAQMPPKYSSKLVDGRRAYDLARQGVDFDLKPRDIEIFDISFVGTIKDSFVFDITCSQGTYIRSIVRDMAYALNTCGYMSFIIRKQSGIFDLKNATTISQLESDPEKYLLPLTFFTDNLLRFDVPKDVSHKVLNGIKIKFDNLPKSDFAVYIDNSLLGIGANDNDSLVIKTRLI